MSSSARNTAKNACFAASATANRCVTSVASAARSVARALRTAARFRPPAKRSMLLEIPAL